MYNGYTAVIKKNNKRIIKKIKFHQTDFFWVINEY